MYIKPSLNRGKLQRCSYHEFVIAPDSITTKPYVCKHCGGTIAQEGLDMYLQGLKHMADTATKKGETQ